MNFHGIRTSIAKEPYRFVIFQGGGGVRTPCSTPSTLDPRMIVVLYGVISSRSLAVTNTEPGGFMALWFYVWEHLKAQSAVVLIKSVPETGSRLKV